MKLAEKIYTCRKKAGLSQDGLAEQIGVSRQAISKWENGEALPETSKLPGLAKALGVSIDWLLSEDEENPDFSTGSENTQTEEETQKSEAWESHSDWSAQEEPQNQNDPASHEDWLDRLPGVLGKLVNRWGWLAGVYVACGGGGIALIGCIAKAAVRGMASLSTVMDPFGSYGTSSGVIITDEFGNTVTGDMADAILDQLNLGGTTGFEQAFYTNNPVSILANCMIFIGIVGIIGGVVLARWLYQRRDEL